MATIQLSPISQQLAGVLLLTIVTIEIGGWFLTTVARGAVGAGSSSAGGRKVTVPATPFQKSFFRAGHAHAGVLVTLSLVCVVLADAAALSGVLGVIARLGVPAAAILMPAGFFFSAMGRGEVTRPNRLMALVWAGALALAAGVLTLGLGLLIG